MNNTNLPSSNNLNNPQQTNEGSSLSNPYQEHPPLSKNERLVLRILIAIYAGILLLYALFDLIFWDTFYDSSLELTKYFRSLPAKIPNNYTPESKPFREFYAYFFSNIMYKWAPAILPFAVIAHPRKSVGLSYIFLYFYNSSFRLLLMQTYRDRRPCWDIDVSDIKCKCGFGKPSGHSSNSTMLYCIIFYEFFWRHPSARKGFKMLISTLIFYYIIGSILWSRIYYAAHTYSHVIIGHTSAALFFLIYVHQEEKILNFTYQILTRYSENLKALSYTLIALMLSVCIWLVNEICYPLKKTNERTPGRCTECFTGINSHGNKLLFGLAYTTVPLAIMLGLLIKGRNKKQGRRVDYVHFSEKNNKNKIFRYEYDPYHCCKRFQSDSNWKNIGQIFLRLLIFSLFNLPYLVSLMINWTNSGVRATSDYLTLFIGVLLFFLVGYDLMKCLGLWREGDMVNLKSDSVKRSSLTSGPGQIQDQQVYAN